MMADWILFPELLFMHIIVSEHPQIQINPAKILERNVEGFLELLNHSCYCQNQIHFWFVGLCILLFI